MNTSLKNARIFDEDSWEYDTFFKEHVKLKAESVSENEEEECKDHDDCKQCPNNEWYSKQIKTESNTDKDPLCIIKHELDCNNIDNIVKVCHENRRLSRKSIKRTRNRDAPYIKHESDFINKSSSSSDKDSSRNSSPAAKLTKKQDYETDTVVLARRQKQIDYGKNTIGYDNYAKLVQRNKRSSDDPVTPNKYFKYSRRGWDGLIKQWRLRLHKYDP